MCMHMYICDAPRILLQEFNIYLMCACVCTLEIDGRGAFKIHLLCIKNERERVVRVYARAA
jgi:hypothetical protein